ncbi:MAG: thiamine pyrophosphate-binding protein [Gemmataceae bacterium]
MKHKVSDLIARFLEAKQIRHVFGIVGAGNVHAFDSIPTYGYSDIVCVHHEQAATMAAEAYYRISGTIGVALVTTGAGSINAMTGVLGAWMESVPILVISGNEPGKFCTPDNPLRAFGVQGYDSPKVASSITKFAARVIEPKSILRILEKAHYIATKERPGPVWVDVPMTVQAAFVEDADLEEFDPETDPETRAIAEASRPAADLPAQLDAIATMLAKAKRPLFWLGHGIRLAGGAGLVPKLLERFRIPTLVSWNGIDLVDSGHPRVYGRAGTYGQRCANFVVQNCDAIVAIGTRLALPQVGYEISEFAREAQIAVVDADPTELAKYPARFNNPVRCDAKVFIESLLERHSNEVEAPSAWFAYCDDLRRRYPWVTDDHKDRDGLINSYTFIDKLNRILKPDQVIVTDAGTALTCTCQVIRVKPPQRFMYSMGLGEMGWGLPAAIGASVVRDGAEVLCINGDGSMMLNLQELQTIVHHRLPIKVVIYLNDGYATIKNTQKALFNGRFSGTDAKTGVTCPDFRKIATAFGIPCYEMKTSAEFDAAMNPFLAEPGAAFCLVHLHPEQTFVPKLSLAVQGDGTLVSPPLEDLSPLLPREELRRNMLVGMHPKSEKLVPT